MVICKATTKNGYQCRQKATLCGYCMSHYYQKKQQLDKKKHET